MEGTYLCICDRCDNEFPAIEILSHTYKDGHTSNLCEKCYEVVNNINEALDKHNIEKPRTDAHHHTVFEQDNPTVDIHKIIDDAMEKGDRSVYILIHSGGMSVTINPYVEDRPKWLHIGNGHFKCSDCGYDHAANCGPLPVYCGGCGEKMYGVKDMLEEDDEEET